MTEEIIEDLTPKVEYTQEEMTKVIVYFVNSDKPERLLFPPDLSTEEIEEYIRTNVPNISVFYVSQKE